MLVLLQIHLRRLMLLCVQQALAAVLWLGLQAAAAAVRESRLCAVQLERLTAWCSAAVAGASRSVR
jgi:hypothetical protein